MTCPPSILAKGLQHELKDDSVTFRTADIEIASRILNFRAAKIALAGIFPLFSQKVANMAPSNTETI